MYNLDKCKLYLLYMIKYENNLTVNNLKNILIEKDDWLSKALIKYEEKQRRNLDYFITFYKTSFNMFRFYS